MSTVVPSILEQNPEAFTRAARSVESFAKLIHVDIADGTFVPNRTLSVSELQSFQPNVPYRIHLMVEKPEHLLQDVLKLNAECIIIHAEATNNLRAVLNVIRDSGKGAGVALNPETPISAIADVVDGLSFILFLSVHPGFQGAPFIPEVLEKIKAFRAEYPEKAIGIDGGITLERIPLLKNLSITNIVVGSAILQADNPEESFHLFQRALTH